MIVSKYICPAASINRQGPFLWIRELKNDSPNYQSMSKKYYQKSKILLVVYSQFGVRAQINSIT